MNGDHNLMRCFLCGGQHLERLFRYKASKYYILRCDRCELMLVAPPPSVDDLNEIYRDEQYMTSLFLSKRWQDWNAKVHFMPSLVRIERYAHPDRMLDVGCSDGLLLRLARSRGWETWGVELSEYYFRIARERHSLNVVTGTLESAMLPNSYFDVVNIGHLLEHLVDPLVLLREVNRVLKDNGLIHIAVPNLDTRVYNVLRAFPSKAIGDKLIAVMGAVKPPEHVITFSTAGLRKTLERSGFDVIETAYTSQARPFFAGWKDWALGLVASPFLKMANSGLHIAMLARKR